MVSLSFLLSHASMLNWNVKSTQCYLSKRGFISWDVTQKRAPHKGQLLLARVAHQELNGDPQHTHMILWPPPKDILLHPLGSLSLLKWRHSSWFTRPPVLVLSLISGCTGHVKLPQRAGQHLLYLWAHLNHSTITLMPGKKQGHSAGGKAPQKPLPGTDRNEEG